MAGAFMAAPPAARADIPAATAPGAAVRDRCAAGRENGTGAGLRPPSGDAAAKHAKRTACLKDAKTKKLVEPTRRRS